MFFTAFNLCSLRLFNLEKQRAKQITNTQKSSPQSYKTQIKILVYSGLALKSSFEQYIMAFQPEQ